MSGRDRGQGTPSASGRRERRGHHDVSTPSRRDMSTPSRREGSRRSGRSGQSGLSHGGGSGDVQSLASPLRTPQPVGVDKLFVRVPSSVGSAKSAASRKFRRDNTLSGYIERLKDVEALCDLALSRMDQTGQKVPSALAEFQSGKNEVLRCVEEIKDLPGSQQILSGKVSDEMFRELRYSGKRLDEFNQIPIDPLMSVLGASGAKVLSGWGLVANDPSKIPAIARLDQLKDTCESLQTIQEILTSQMSVLNWTLEEAVTPPAEQKIITPRGGGKDSPFAPDEDATCCWCCSSEPIPEPESDKKGGQKRPT